VTSEKELLKHFI